MKKIIRLTESDLMRIVKRVINEEMTKVDDKTFTSQGYGKDPYQYKAVIVPTNSQIPNTPQVTIRYYVARKGSNPKWIKITNKTAMEQIRAQQFPSLGDATMNKVNLGRSEDGALVTTDSNGRTTKGITRGDTIKAFADIFPCVEQSMKPTDKKRFWGESLTFQIDGMIYSVDKRPGMTPSGWILKGHDMNADPLNPKFKYYKNCDEFKQRNTKK